MKSRTLTIDAPVPDFDLPGIDGRQHTLVDYRGKNVALVFYRGHW